MDREAPIRVLLVTDRPFRLITGKAILELTGEMEVITASDGMEGLELAWSACPDVMVVSAILPLLSGVELLRRYRAGGGQAKVIMALAVMRETARAAVLAAGADLVLLEPMEIVELIHHIRFLAWGMARPCRKLLLSMGAPDDWAGTDQAAFCAGALAEGRCALIKETYVDAAAFYHTDPRCVEVNIRRVIQVLHRADSPAYRALPGLTPGDRPPSNKDFLLSLSRAAKIPL